MLQHYLKYIHLLLVALAALLLTACKSHKDEPTPPEPPAKGRTIMVYMLADNNLGSYGYDAADLDEMLVGVTGGALGDSHNRLLVFHEPSEDSAPELKEVTPEGIKVLKTYPSDVIGVEASTMSMALNDMKAFAPAADYGLILWSHATGWIEDGIAESDNSGIAPLSFGMSGRNKMNIKTLARVLEGRSLSFLYFDCCYMMGVEAVYQLRNVAPVIAGSPTELPSAGMPYDLTLPYFFADGEPDIIGAARTTFHLYDSKSGSSRTSTMSVISTQGLPALARTTADIYATSKAGMPGDGFVPQRYTAVSAERCNYFDFAQYVRRLAIDSPDLEAAFNAALADVVLYEDATPYLWSSVQLKHHSGLSTYILPSLEDASDRGYSTLDWWTDVASRLL